MSTVGLIIEKQFLARKHIKHLARAIEEGIDKMQAAGVKVSDVIVHPDCRSICRHLSDKHLNMIADELPPHQIPPAGERARLSVWYDMFVVHNCNTVFILHSHKHKRDWRFAVAYGCAAEQNKPVFAFSHYDDDRGTYYGVRALRKAESKWWWKKWATDGYTYADDCIVSQTPEDVEDDAVAPPSPKRSRLTEGC